MKYIKKTIPCGVVVEQVEASSLKEVDKNYVQLKIYNGPESTGTWARTLHPWDNGIPTTSFVGGVELIIHRKNLKQLRLILNQLIAQVK